MTYSALQFNANSLYQPVTQMAHGFTTPGLIVRFNGTNFVKADALSSNNSQMVGMVSNISSVDSFYITQIGFVSGLTTIPAEGGTYAPGTLYYLALNASAGLLTATRPVTSGQFVAPCFIPYTATSGFFFANVGEPVEDGVDQWIQVTTDTSMAVEKGYTTNSASKLNMTLPASMVYGETIIVASQDTGGFRIVQPANVTLIFGIENTTVGADGYIETTTEGSVVEMLCVVDTGPGYELQVIRSMGNFTIV